MTDQLTQDQQLAALGRYEYGWADSDVAGAAAQRGLNEAVVRDISARKQEPAGKFVTAPVKAAAQTDVRQTYEVRIGHRNQRVLRATDNHPVLALRDERAPGAARARWVRQWLTVGELRVGDRIAVPRRLPD